MRNGLRSRGARLAALLLLSALATLPIARQARPAVAGSATVRAAFLYLGPIDTDTWTKAHERGRQGAGRGVDTTYFQLVRADDAEGIIRRAIGEGYNAIFSTSFDFADAVLKVAPEFPNIVFEQATGVTTAANVKTYDGRIYQAWYEAGMVAGAMTAADTIGYVAPMPISEVIRDLNAFTLGARSVNPAAHVYPAWINTFFDPDKERAAADELIDAGADVLARESDSTEPEQVASERGVWTGAYNDVWDPAEQLLPNLLTAPVWFWGVYYERELQALAAGSWSNTPVWWGIEPAGIFNLWFFSPSVPEEVRAKVNLVYLGMRAGDFDVFAGPLSDNGGRARVPAGDRLSDAQLLSLDWLVDGVVGAIPPP